MNYMFNNLKALVTGAASGIGEATTKLLIDAGCKVVICDINKEKGEEIQNKYNNGNIKYIYADIRNENNVIEMVNIASEWLGGVGILINNAGVGGVGDPKILDELSLETWDITINTNLRGTYLVSKYCLPHMKKTGGAIVNIISTYALVGGPQLGAYCASKGGILALTRNMAIDYAQYGIRVNAIAPGFVDTPMLRRDINKDLNPEEALKGILSAIPQGELMKAEEVGRVILFLASEDSKIMTGSTVVADGGYTAR